MADKHEEIVYEYNGKVYLNITNKCPCACTFCIRSQTNAIGSASSLWLDHNPDFEEVKRAIDEFDLNGCEEVVFCGYGEPTNSLDVLKKTAEYIKSEYGLRTRVNTNGLGSLINERDISAELCQSVDFISISLNCSNAEDYLNTVRPKFGIDSYDAMLDFAKKCRAITDKVAFSVVDVIGEQEIEKCRKIAQELSIPLRVRVFSGS